MQLDNNRAGEAAGQAGTWGRPLSRAELADSVGTVRDAISGQPEARAMLAAVCGGEETLEALFDPRGVGIGRFSTLLGVPATTLRHLIREELLHPIRVNGKFCFLLHNVNELRGVQQWQSLGLTLEETRAFVGAQELTGLLLPQLGGLMTVSRAPGCPTPERVQELRETALERIRKANARREEKLLVLTRQLEQAQALELAVQDYKSSDSLQDERTPG